MIEDNDEIIKLKNITTYELHKGTMFDIMPKVIICLMLHTV